MYAGIPFKAATSHLKYMLWPQLLTGPSNSCQIGNEVYKFVPQEVKQIDLISIYLPFNNCSKKFEFFQCAVYIINVITSRNDGSHFGQYFFIHSRLLRSRYSTPQPYIWRMVTSSQSSIPSTTYLIRVHNLNKLLSST